ncbi:Gfo/Idh/MocA family oxidoreductase [Pseudomonadota bacterium]|nr:Gfo/Idh/MocA family oxidoreductase [Pseudomonadota bacterium]
MKNKIRLSIVGTGYFSQFHVDAWKRLGVEIVGICSLNKNEALERSKQFNNCKVFQDFKTMITETKSTLIDIIVPPQFHLNFIKIAAESNVNIICQKPFTNSIKEAKEAVKIAEKYGVTIAVHENFRYQPWYLKINEILKSSLLGDLFQVSFRMRPGDGQGKDAYLSRQPYFQKMERFMIHETAIHIIDVFRFLFGDIKSVFAKLSKLNNYIKGEDAGIVFFEFESGMRGLFDGNRLSDHIAIDRRLTIGEMLIEGSEGSLRLNGNGEIFYRKFNENEEKIIEYEWNNIGFAGDSVFYYQKHLLDHFVNGQELKNEAKEYIENLKIEDLIYKSNQSNQFIEKDK